MKKGIEQRIPQARAEGLIIHNLCDEILIYNSDQHTAHCLNQMAALVWKCCDGQKSIGDTIRLLEQELNAPVDEEVVWLALDQLNRAQLLLEPGDEAAARRTSSRRDLIRRIGWAAAALPLVTSIIVPTAIQAASCLGTGQSCMSSAQCCSGMCVSNQCL